jgi:hypothetical protein
MKFYINTMEAVRFKPLGWGPHEAESLNAVVENKRVELRQIAEAEMVGNDHSKDGVSASPEFSAAVERHLGQDLIPAFIASLEQGVQPGWYFGDIPKPSAEWSPPQKPGVFR